MKKALIGTAVLIAGLFLFCTRVFACEDEENYILPKAGFQLFIEEIECKPIHHLPSYILTEEDADLLLRVGVCEAGEVDSEGIANVMQVVLNRVFESDDFPGTIEEVIFQRKQFSTAHRLAKANITPEAYEALDAVCMGEYKSNKALYFESLPGKVWSNVHDYLFTYGGHDFYK